MHCSYANLTELFINMVGTFGVRIMVINEIIIRLTLWFIIIMVDSSWVEIEEEM